MQSCRSVANETEVYASGVPLSALTGAKRSAPLQAKNVFAAWSTRKLFDDYNGPILNVRNNTLAFLDVGLNKNGDLDARKISEYCGATGNGYTSTWYDQSGNGLDLVQPNLSQNPRICNAGQVELLNFRPALYSQGPYIRLSSPAPFPDGSEVRLCMVLQNNAPYGYGGLGSSALTMHEDPLRFSAHIPWVDGKVLFDSGSVGYRLSSAVLSVPQDAPIQITLINSGSANLKAIRYNGKILAAYGVSPVAPINSMTIFGRLPLDQYDASFDGHFSEVVLFKPNVSDNEIAMFERNQMAYFGVH
jgi:hypothetical protein